MTPRLVVLKRIERLYCVVEEMHSMALSQAAGLVYEAETAMSAQCAKVRVAAENMRVGLVVDDPQQRTFARAQRELGALRREQLKQFQRTREIARVQASHEYGLSRVKSEQMKSVVAAKETAELLIANRRIQAASDDRFLSRLRWSQLRAEEKQ